MDRDERQKYFCPATKYKKGTKGKRVSIFDKRRPNWKAGDYEKECRDPRGGLLQCHPHRLSECKGATVHRSVSVKLVKGHKLEMCKRTMMFTDTMVRFLVNLATGMSAEADSRRYCNPGSMTRRRRRANRKGRRRGRRRRANEKGRRKGRPERAHD